MTAIFMVWNTTGFALAADDAISVQSPDENGKERTLWTDTGEKIFMPENHKIAIATAADMKINNIQISNILAGWNMQLKKEVSHLNDYVIDFLNYLSKCEFPLNFQYQNDLKIRCELIMNTFSDSYKDNPENIDNKIGELINYWTNIEPKNVFGPDFQAEFLADDVENEGYDDLFLDFCINWAKGKTADSQNENQIEVVKELITQTFLATFGTELDAKQKWHKNLQEQLIPYLINYIDSENYAKLLFVGYGIDDWIPHLVKVSIHPSLNGAPRARILQVANPLKIWFSHLAQTDQVDMFLQGYNNDYHEALLSFVPEESRESALEHLGSLEEKRFSEMRKKVNNLSLAKLEFVARSFVEMESLGSFLVEYLPSVGGNIKVVSMTR